MSDAYGTRMRILPLLLVAACSSAAVAPIDPEIAKDGGDDKVTSVDAGPDVAPAPAPSATGSVSIGIDSGGLFADLFDVSVKVDGVEKVHETREWSNNPFPYLASVEGKEGALVELALVGNVYDAGVPKPVLTRTARAHVVGGTKKLLYVRLDNKCSSYAYNTTPAPTCAAPQTCIAGTCTSDVADPLPEFYDTWATTPPSACGTGTPTLEIGKGENAFVAMTAGETVEAQCGGQGGHHIWLALRMTGLDQFGTISSISATNGTTSVDLTAYADPYAHIGSTCELAGVRFQLDTAHPLADFAGKSLDVTVVLKDRLNQTVTGTKQVKIGSNPCN